MTEVAEAPKAHRRSASQLESYLKCGEAYRLEKIEKAPAYPAAWLTQGIAFHEAIEKWEKTGRVFPVAEVIKWFEDAWDRTIAEQLAQEPRVSVWLTGGRTKPETDIENRFNRGKQQVIDYIEWATATANEWRVWQFAPDNYAVEIPFDIILNGVRVVGFIDQLIEWPNGLISVRDLKTGTKLPAHPRQLGIYRLATDEVLGILPDWGDFFMSKNCAPTAPYDLTRFTRDRVGRWFKNLDDAVTAGQFTPNPGDHCRICSVSRFCDFNGSEAHMYSIDRKEPLD